MAIQPALALKELLENRVDSGAPDIDVRLAQSGARQPRALRSAGFSALEDFGVSA